MQHHLSASRGNATVGSRWTPGQYSLFRVLLGTYLFVHFAHLLPWGAEVFSNEGMLAQGAASPLFHLFPSVLLASDSPAAVAALIVAGSLSGVLLAFGYQDKLAAVVAWYVLACLFSRNPLIANPALPFVGWMLLAHLFIAPPRWGSGAAAGRAESSRDWATSRPIFVAAWVILALSYSYSGYTKLLSPSWVSGDTVSYVLQNPLARDYFLRDQLLNLPAGVLRGLTWAIMWVELLFAPLALITRLRPILWAVMLSVQVGFLLLLNFADLTVPMLLFHLLTFDPSWVRSTRVRSSETIYYDGHCGLCHWVVRFVLAEDAAAQFRFSPLQGQSFREAVSASERATLPDSFVVIDERGRLFTKGRAVVHVLGRLGGLWGILGVGLRAAPGIVLDLGYTGIGRIRHRLFRRPPDTCPVVPPTLRSRFSP
jgi:predicted DCC family thiol-disulfide oxidoreductase YuxK